ncbi:hypothetical protein DYB36_012484, partial [Aphanomyces astaci]
VVVAVLRRGFGDSDTALLLGKMPPEDQAHLVEGVGSTIEPSGAEASTATHATLEEQVAQMTSMGETWKTPPRRP